MRYDVDVVIIGGGPAGLTAAQYSARAALKTLLAESTAFGGQALLIDALENYPGGGVKSGYEFSEALREQAESFGASLTLESVVSLHKKDGRFEAVLSDDSTVRAAAVILASGARHRPLGIPGEETFAGKGVSYCATCDGPFFKKKKIFVAGGGDAACDEAYFLSKLSSDVTILVRKAEFRAQKKLADRVLNNPTVQVRFCTRVLEIKGAGKVNTLLLEDTANGKKYETEADALFIFAGILPNTGLFNHKDAALTLETDASGFIKTSLSLETSVSGIFAAGDVRSSPFRQVVVAAGDGAIAAHAAAEYIAALPQ